MYIHSKEKNRFREKISRLFHMFYLYYNNNIFLVTKVICCKQVLYFRQTNLASNESYSLEAKLIFNLTKIFFTCVQLMSNNICYKDKNKFVI